MEAAARYGIPISGHVSFKAYGYEKSDLGKMSGKEVRQTLDSVGMNAENCQFYSAELHDKFKETMTYSRDLGLKYIICAPGSGHRATADDWKWQPEQLNELGNRVQLEGLQLGYHDREKSRTHPVQHMVIVRTVENRLERQMRTRIG